MEGGGQARGQDAGHWEMRVEDAEGSMDELLWKEAWL